MNNIDEKGKLKPYVKEKDGIYNPLTGKYDLPEGGYRFPVYPSKDMLGNLIWKPYPTSKIMKNSLLSKDHKINRKGKTFIQVVKDQFGGFVKNIFHFPKSIGMYK